ncbi:uncharacterized protein [Spinacia oleracea]|uniref:Transmembrane protein n=1 Tax=Spinacia oleracea TaxID=3562 RepID=A0A9R0I3A6_SPIOL|nr:uncharacterized protein LOC110781957 [Spinacia oleracea]
MCCCPSKVCMLCSCLVIVVVTIGFLFGFGVFKNGFHKLKHTIDVSQPVGYNYDGNYLVAPPPFF